ncbi:MAG TPA: hypothetical protein VKA50_12640 [Gammaproteobacteria bacterium]|nr:hypothetical protein [Gammaproteobacteria bacterium]
MKALFLVILIAFPLYTNAAHAAGATDGFALECKNLEGVETTHFKALNREAMKVNKALCRSLLSTDPGVSDQQQRILLREFADVAQQEAAKIADVVPIQNFAKPFEGLKTTVAQGDIYSKHLPSFNVEPSPANDTEFIFYFADIARRASFKVADNGKCLVKYSEPCNKLFDEYGKVFDQYKSSYTKLTAHQTLEKLDRLSLQWDTYLEQARSQTTLDLLLTTAMESRHFKQGHLVGPPARQWSTLHPSLVYEHFSKAKGDEKYKVGVAIEWFGVNWWNKTSSPLGIPFGVSLASTYNDWGDSPSAGHGLMFHFDNRYSVGWSRRDGENSVYVSIDLMNAIADKKQQFDEYKSRMGTLQP